MPRYYYLYPSHDGPFPNPFTAGDPLVKLPHEAIMAFRSQLEERDKVARATAGEREDAQEGAVKVLEHELNLFTGEACRIAFMGLFNRMLEADPRRPAPSCVRLRLCARRRVTMQPPPPPAAALALLWPNSRSVKAGCRPGSLEPSSSRQAP